MYVTATAQIRVGHQANTLGSNLKPINLVKLLFVATIVVAKIGIIIVIFS